MFWAANVSKLGKTGDALWVGGVALTYTALMQAGLNATNWKPTTRALVGGGVGVATGIAAVALGAPATGVGLATGGIVSGGMATVTAVQQSGLLRSLDGTQAPAAAAPAPVQQLTAPVAPQTGSAVGAAANAPAPATAGAVYDRDRGTWRKAG